MIGRIELAQRTCGRIARIDVKLLASSCLLLVQFEKIRLAQINLAAHLAHVRHLAALQVLRNFLDRAHIGVTSSPSAPSPRVAPLTSLPPS